MQPTATEPGLRPPSALFTLVQRILGMADNQQGGQLPTGQGGLVSYFESESGFEIGPKTVVALVAVVAAVELTLQTRAILRLFV